MRPADSHLTPQEFELVLLSGAGPNLTTAERAQAQEAKQHLEGCEYCQSVAKQYAKVDSALGRLKARPNPVRKKDCPEESVWLEVAAGLADEGQSAKLLEHAAQCDYCGMLLREAAEDLAAQADEEIEAAVAALATAQPDRQWALAAMLAKTPGAEVQQAAQASGGRKLGAEKSRHIWWPRLLWAAAGLAVVVAAASLVWLRTREPDVNKLLAQTYTEQRTIELRMPGAKYGPMRVKRGPGNTQWPEQFYRARMILSRDLAKHMDDPTWLQAQARADLLQKNYDNALNELDEALALKPNDSSLLIDKATILYMRAHEKGHEIDFGEAAELLGKVLSSNPNDPVALFNRALVYEKLNNPPEAIKDLEHYLQIDPVGPWADEAKDHLKTLKELASAHDSSAEALLDSAAFARMASDPAKVSILDSRIEDYQDRAIKDWLPQSYSGSLQSSEQEERLKALQALSDLLAAHHADQWLKDFLATAKRSREFIAGLDYLKQSMDESDAGNPEAAYNTARLAEQLFIAAGSLPGAVRAQWEQVHARQRQEDGFGCLKEARRLAPALRDTGYVWIKIQLGIDQGACLLKIGSYDQGRAFVSGALKVALASGFPNLKLRDLGMACSAETVAGNFASAWAANEEGLQEYWGSPAAHSARAHQFYEDLAYASESMQWLHLAIAFATESARNAAEAGNQNIEILSWQYVAKLAIQAGELDTAAAAVQQADNLSRSLAPANPEQHQDVLRSSRIYRETTFAEIAIRQGKLSEAEKRLEQIQPDISPQDSLALLRSFHLAKAKLLEQQGKVDDAENEFLDILKIVDSKRKKLHKPADQESWSDENRGLYEELVYLEIKKGDSEKALNLWQWYRAAEIHPTDSFKSVEEYLNGHHPSQFARSLSNEILLSYALLPQGLVAWITDERGTRAHFSALDAATLFRQTVNFGTLCADSTSNLSSLQAQGRHLHEIFIGPVANQLVPEKTLVVDMDRRIGDLPFQALVTPDGRYLGQKYTVVFSPGLLYTEYLRDPERVNQNSNALIVGSTANILQDGTSFPPNEDAMEEAREIASRFDRPKKLFGGEATVESIQNALPHAELFHFSGHALSSVAEEGLLVFGPQHGGTTLWSNQALNLDLFANVELAVLSACSTGRVFDNRRETHGALVRSMLAARVPNVVASRWDVDSSKTRAFFRFFYDGLFAGKSVPRALQYAEGKLMEDPQTQHPYYWAAFSAFGHA